ncbi:TMEM175 family protein [Flavihumibacter fluvii]|uniref:TMEM175 family protein n=1 Tax=Flavihumibacter fluvii TaxID=2838157 RepID=UPI001BDF0064|nr:TMEM175 family protein [Flavihumibacter fluvii]ULQ50760.1 TMEM175 family protein [Flavihumibacter fluvii]
MNKNRLEAFTDGVYAIIITIMVLELKVPHSPTLGSYVEMWPVFISYAVSFLFVGLNWANHHHLFQTVSKINNRVLWINMFNLFVLSLVPFATAAMGENSFKSITVTIYASLLTLSIIVYMVLVNLLCRVHGKGSAFSNQFRGRSKSYISLCLNIIAIVISIIGFPKVAFLLIVLTSFAWFIPNHIFENRP